MRKILLITSIVILPILTFAQSEKGELKGVVTYFFNDNYGSKPDVGAKVIIQKIIPPSNRSPEEMKYDTYLLNLQRDILQLEEKIKNDNKEITELDTVEKKLAAVKNKAIKTINNKSNQVKKNKSLKDEIDVEQKVHDIIIDSFSKFNIYTESANSVIEFYDFKIDAEIFRHYREQIKIIDSFGKLSGESENKLKFRRLQVDKEQNISNKKNKENLYKYISNMLQYDEDMDKTKYVIIKQNENMDISNLIFKLKSAERKREYLKVAPTRKFKDKMIEELEELGVYPEEKFNALDSTVSDAIRNIVYGKDTRTTSVDGNGNYSIKLEPGFYYLIITSSGRKNHSMTECFGQISGIDIINIKSGETIEKSEDFKGGY